MTQKNFFNLSAITKRIQEILQPAIGKTFWVKAEISSGRERGGSFYCDLVETDQNGKIIAKLNCSIWSRDLDRIRNQFKESNLDLKLDNGTAVGFNCDLQYSPQYGLSLKVNDADPAFALGEMELRKKEILDRLTKEGLLEPNKRIHVTMLPQKIGLITSQGSAAYNDFLKTLNTSRFGFKIFLTDSMVQGNQTEAAIIRALDTLEKLDIDLVIIIRGGGSKSDLFYLDNELIARRIASYRLPVWTGIGHEIDTSILDHVANRYFKTPTAVAEEIIARYIEMSRYLDESMNRFKSTWSYRFEIDKKWLEDAKIGITQGARKYIDATRGELKNTANLLGSKVATRLANAKANLTVSKRVIVSAPLMLINRSGERLKEKKERLFIDWKRQITEAQKDLDSIKSRFHVDRFMQRTCQEYQCIDSWKDWFLEKFNSRLKAHSQKLDYQISRFRKEAIISRIVKERESLQNKQSTLKASSPETSLKRGFSLVYDKSGKLIKSVTGVVVGEMLNTKLFDGEILSTIDEIKGDK